MYDSNDSYDCYGNYHFDYDDDGFGYDDYDREEFEDYGGNSSIIKNDDLIHARDYVEHDYVE